MKGKTNENSYSKYDTVRFVRRHLRDYKFSREKKELRKKIQSFSKKNAETVYKEFFDAVDNNIFYCLFGVKKIHQPQITSRRYRRYFVYDKNRALYIPFDKYNGDWEEIFDSEWYQFSEDLKKKESELKQSLEKIRLLYEDSRLFCFFAVAFRLIAGGFYVAGLYLLEKAIRRIGEYLYIVLMVICVLLILIWVGEILQQYRYYGMAKEITRGISKPVTKKEYKKINKKGWRRAADLNELSRSLDDLKEKLERRKEKQENFFEIYLIRVIAACLTYIVEFLHCRFARVVLVVFAVLFFFFSILPDSVLHLYHSIKEEIDPSEEYLVAADRVVVMENPDAYSSPLGELYKGDTISVLEEKGEINREIWYRIPLSGDISGWINRKQIRKLQSDEVAIVDARLSDGTVLGTELYDGYLESVWEFSSEALEQEQAITLTLNDTFAIKGIIIYNGNYKDNNYHRHGRVTEVAVCIDGSEEIVKEIGTEYNLDGYLIQVSGKAKKITIRPTKIQSDKRSEKEVCETACISEIIILKEESTILKVLRGIGEWLD